MNTVRTVSDTKRAFYSRHSRPVNSLYRRVVEELMVEMHLLSVSVDFSYDPIYALGVVTTFDRFMQGYRPEADRESIFAAICAGVEADAQTLRQDAQQVAESVKGLDLAGFKAAIADLESGGDGFKGYLAAIATREKFKYTRLFGVGLYTLAESIDAKALATKESRIELFQPLCDAMGIPSERLDKDLELYRSNLEKMVQAKAVMDDIIAADRKKKEDRAKAKLASESAEADSPDPVAAAPEPNSEPPADA